MKLFLKELKTLLGLVLGVLLVLVLFLNNKLGGEILEYEIITNIISGMCLSYIVLSFILKERS